MTTIVKMRTGEKSVLDCVLETAFKARKALRKRDAKVKVLVVDNLIQKERHHGFH
jgi:hypothetical protein